MRKPCTDCPFYKKFKIERTAWEIYCGMRGSTSGHCEKYTHYWKECQEYKNWQVVQKAEKLQRALKNNGLLEENDGEK